VEREELERERGKQRESVCVRPWDCRLVSPGQAGGTEKIERGKRGFQRWATG
jgi:hypothetical protein